MHIDYQGALIPDLRAYSDLTTLERDVAMVPSYKLDTVGLFASKLVVEHYQGTITSRHDSDHSLIAFNMHL